MLLEESYFSIYYKFCDVCLLYACEESTVCLNSVMYVSFWLEVQWRGNEILWRKWCSHQDCWLKVADKEKKAFGMIVVYSFTLFQSIEPQYQWLLFALASYLISLLSCMKIYHEPDPFDWFLFQYWGYTHIPYFCVYKMGGGGGAVGFTFKTIPKGFLDRSRFWVLFQRTDQI